MKGENTLKPKMTPRTFLVKYGLFLIFALLFIFFTIAANPYFLDVDNLINIHVNVSVMGIIATAMTTAIIGRGPDLTVGSIVAFVGSIQANLVMIQGLPWWVGILVSLMIGVFVGFLNGLIIVKFNLAPFIVTLGMMNVIRGLSFVMVDGMSTFITDDALMFLGQHKIADVVPVSIIVLVVSFIIFHYISTKTVFGRHIYASGGNRTAARLAGINTNRVGIMLYMLTGLMAAIAGTVLLGIGGAAIPSAGDSYALDIITAVLLGGTTLAGGQGSVARTFVGIIIIGMLNNGMALMGLQTFWQTSARGAFLIGAIILDSLQHKTKN